MGTLFYFILMVALGIGVNKLQEAAQPKKKQPENITPDDDVALKPAPKSQVIKKHTSNKETQLFNSHQTHANQQRKAPAKRNAGKARNAGNLKRNQAPKKQVVRAEKPIAASQQNVVFPKSELDNPKSLVTTSQKNTDATAILCDLFMELQDYLRGVALESLPISRLDREFIADFMTISNDGFHYTSRHEFIVLAGRFERIVFKNPGLPDLLVKKIKKITDYVVFLQTGQKNSAKPAKEALKIASTKAKKPVMKLNKLTQMVVYKEIFDKPVSKR